MKTYTLTCNKCGKTIYGRYFSVLTAYDGDPTFESKHYDICEECMSEVIDEYTPSDFFKTSDWNQFKN